MALNPALPEPTGQAQRLVTEVAALMRRVETLERALQGGTASAHPVVDALPAAGRAGRVLMLASDGKLYADTGAAWVAQT